MPETIFGLQADTVWGIIISAVIGIITTWVFALRERRIKEPCWEISSEDLIQLTSKIEGLNLEYNGHKIERLVSSQVTFWNRGKEIIKKEDIDEPLFVVSKDEATKILAAQILEFSRQANEFEIEAKENRVYLSFKALDAGEGARFQILHTGTITSTWDLRGHILGAKSIQLLTQTPENNLTPKRQTHSFIKIILEVIAVWTGLAIAAGFFLWLRDTLPWPSDIREFMNNGIGSVICIFVALWFGLGLVVWIREEVNKVGRRPMKLLDEGVSHKVHAEGEQH